MTLGISYKLASGSFEEHIKQLEFPIASAATKAVHEGSLILKTRGRANIAAAGLKKAWQNALQVKVYPSRRESIDAAMFGYHKIPYASLLEEGGTITGKPLLWVPLKGTPRKLGRRRMSPGNMRRLAGVDLFSMKSKGGTPLLATRVRVPAAMAHRRKVRASMSLLQRGATGSGVLKTLPLFHGVKSITIKKRLHLTGVFQNVHAILPELYFRNLEAN